MQRTWKGFYVPKNPKKYRGDTRSIIYRSSWELNLMRKLDLSPEVLEWASEEFSIPYFDKTATPPRVRRYYPDFWVRTVKGVMVLEVKPEKETKPPKPPPKRATKRYLEELMTYHRNDAKWFAARKFCEERQWVFKVVTEKHLGITY